jgi:hypothetical protein
MSAKKVLFLVTCMVMLVTNVCFAWTPVQMNDEMGAGAFQSKYASIINATDNGVSTYGMSDLKHIGNNGTYDVYGSFNLHDNNNIIEYFCNQAGFVSGIVITSTNPDTINLQGTMMIEFATDDDEAENYDTIHGLIARSTRDLCACGYHSTRKNRYYDIRTKKYGNIYYTKISGGLK